MKKLLLSIAFAVIAMPAFAELLPMDVYHGVAPKWVYIGSNVFYDENSIVVTSGNGIYGGGVRLYNVKNHTDFHAFMTGNSCRDEDFKITYLYPSGQSEGVLVKHDDNTRNMTLANAIWWGSHRTCDQNQGSYKDAVDELGLPYVSWNDFLNNISNNSKD